MSPSGGGGGGGGKKKRKEGTQARSEQLIETKSLCHSTGRRRVKNSRSRLQSLMVLLVFGAACLAESCRAETDMTRREVLVHAASQRSCNLPRIMAL